MSVDSVFRPLRPVLTIHDQVCSVLADTPASARVGSLAEYKRRVRQRSSYRGRGEQAGHHTEKLAWRIHGPAPRGRYRDARRHSCDKF